MNSHCIARRYQRKCGFRAPLREANGSTLAQRVNCHVINGAVDRWWTIMTGAPPPLSMTMRERIQADAEEALA